MIHRSDTVPSILERLDRRAEGPPASEAEALALAEQLAPTAELRVYPRSITAAGGCLHFLGRRETEKLLCLLSRNGTSRFLGETRQIRIEGELLTLRLCPTDSMNASLLRDALPFTAPTPIGPGASVGCGDRLGLATPGHVRAVRRHGMTPVFAQQSMREMIRSGRTPDDVLDDASWGVFQEGWREGFGADADHLKTTEDIDVCVAAGFTFFTLDPGEHVDDEAVTCGPEALEQKVRDLPWDLLRASPDRTRETYLEGSRVGEGGDLFPDEAALWRAAAKYGRAIAFAAWLARHLDGRMGGGPYELEVSVDETDSPTTVPEHFYVASELRRLGVSWHSLALRFDGRFEKGVDFIGDVDDFERTLARHADLARRLGPYKLGLHSGSDKFSLYPILARHAGEMVHVKTAGTSYLEALRVVAETEPALFREILSFARERYEKDRATYHVSAELDRVAGPDGIEDEALAAVLEDFHGRQVLHVTFGSVLAERGEDGEYLFRDRLLDALRRREESYYRALERHFDRHLAPFTT